MAGWLTQYLASLVRLPPLSATEIRPRDVDCRPIMALRGDVWPCDPPTPTHPFPSLPLSLSFTFPIPSFLFPLLPFPLFPFSTYSFSPLYLHCPYFPSFSSFSVLHLSPFCSPFSTFFSFTSFHPPIPFLCLLFYPFTCSFLFPLSCLSPLQLPLPFPSSRQQNIASYRSSFSFFSDL